MITLIILIAIALITLPLALVLTPLLLRAGQSWPEQSLDHSIAAPHEDLFYDWDALNAYIAEGEEYRIEVGDVAVLYPSLSYAMAAMRPEMEIDQLPEWNSQGITDADITFFVDQLYYATDNPSVHRYS